VYLQKGHHRIPAPTYEPSQTSVPRDGSSAHSSFTASIARATRARISFMSRKSFGSRKSLRSLKSASPFCETPPPLPESDLAGSLALFRGNVHLLGRDAVDRRARVKLSGLETYTVNQAWKRASVSTVGWMGSSDTAWDDEVSSPPNSSSGLIQNGKPTPGRFHKRKLSSLVLHTQPHSGLDDVPPLPPHVLLTHAAVERYEDERQGDLVSPMPTITSGPFPLPL
jgi:hypothetical protein